MAATPAPATAAISLSSLSHSELIAAIHRDVRIQPELSHQYDTCRNRLRHPMLPCLECRAAYHTSPSFASMMIEEDVDDKKNYGHVRALVRCLYATYTPLVGDYFRALLSRKPTPPQTNQGVTASAASICIASGRGAIPDPTTIMVWYYNHHLSLLELVCTMPMDRFPLLTIMLDYLTNVVYHGKSDDARRIALSQQRSVHGTTAMHYAAASGHIPYVRVLLAAGMTIDQRDAHDTLPLSWALNHCHTDMVKFILQQYTTSSSSGGASTSASGSDSGGIVRAFRTRDRLDRTPVQLAIEIGARDIVDIMYESCAVVFQDAPKCHRNGASLLHLAARSMVSFIPTLLSQSSSASVMIDEKLSTNGNTPLHEAVKYGNLAAVMALVDARANVQARNKYGDTIIHIAAEENHSHIVEYILQHIATATSKPSSSSMTSDDHKRSGGGYVVSEWLEMVDGERNGGATPLWRACAMGSNDVIRVLIDAKANVNHGTRVADRTVFHVSNGPALGTGLQASLPSTVSSSPSDRFNCMMVAAANGHTEAVQMLYHTGADVMVMSRNGYGNPRRATAMGHAAITCQYHIITAMIILGIPIDGTIKRGSTTWRADYGGSLTSFDIFGTYGTQEFFNERNEPLDITTITGRDIPFNRSVDSFHLYGRVHRAIADGRHIVDEIIPKWSAQLNDGQLTLLLPSVIWRVVLSYLF